MRTEKEQNIISYEEIKLVNSFRELCITITKRTRKGDWAEGAVYAKADIAEHSAFNLLNWANCYLNANISERQMHPRVNH